MATVAAAAAPRAAAAAAADASAEARPRPPRPSEQACRVAVAQMTSTSDPEHNFAVCASLARQAAEAGARVLFLPECFAFIGERQADALRFAQPLSGPLMRRYRRLALRHGLWVSLGGFQERWCPSPSSGDDGEEEEGGRAVGGGLIESDDEETDDGDDDYDDYDDGAKKGEEPAAAAAAAREEQEEKQGAPAEKVFNAHVVVDPRGRIAAVYRKIHLFDVDVPGGPVLLESRTTLPGKRLVVVPGPKHGSGGDDGKGDGDEGGGVGRRCPCGPLGLTTCYDLRFPEMFAALAFGGGSSGSSGPEEQDERARVIAVPSAFTKTTGAAHWELLLRARAVETQCYVVAAAQAGKHNGDASSSTSSSSPPAARESYGDAIVVDPWGEVVARVPQGPLATGLAVADLSWARLAEVRRRMPIAEHREAGRRRWAGGVS